MNSRVGRRTFCRRMALAGLGVLILDGSRSACTYGANEKLNVALVGR